MEELHLSPEYVAGLFDGEGWFSISLNKSAPRSKYGHFYLHTALVVRERWVVDTLARQFGGSVHRVKPRQDTHSEAFRWTVTNRSCLRFLDEIGPLILMKQDQVKLAREFTEYKIAKGFKPLTQANLEYYRECYLKMKVLNQKGIGKT